MKTSNKTMLALACAFLFVCASMAAATGQTHARKLKTYNQNDVRYGPGCTNGCCDTSQGFYCYRFGNKGEPSSYATCMTYGACFQGNGKSDYGKWNRWGSCKNLAACDY